jgi:hypothetical protein
MRAVDGDGKGAAAMNLRAHAVQPDVMGGPEPAEEATDVMHGPGRASDVMGGPEPAEEATDVMGGPGGRVR